MNSSAYNRGKQLVRKVIPKFVRRFGWQIYYLVKNRGAITARILDTCKKVMWNAEFMHRPYLKRWVLEIIRFAGDFVLLLNQSRGVDLYQIICEGDIVIYSGGPTELNELNELLFEGKDVEITNLGKVSVWKLPSLAEEYLDNGAQLVILETSRLFPSRFRAPYRISAPIWIKQELSISSDLETMLSGGKFGPIRRLINRAQRMDFSYRFTRDEADFDLFYHQMYVPLIVNRHKESGYVEPYESLYWWFNRGGLILSTRNGKPVAGILVATTKEKGLFVDIGVLDADPELIRLGIQTITIWSMIQWFFSQGVRRIDMGGSKALRSNGVFIFKHRWGATVYRLYSFIRSKRHFLMKSPTAVMFSAGKCVRADY